jgi:spore maturation protein CgeB
MYDVCFIGNFHSSYRDKRIDYAEALFRAFPNFFYGNRFFNEMAEKFAQSKIVFNQALNNDVNMRVFEACCSGSFQLSSEIMDNGLEDLGYKSGTNFMSYVSIEEMLEKASYYLEHEAEREAIAKAGYEHTTANHTYMHRVKEIMEAINGKRGC